MEIRKPKVWMDLEEYKNFNKFFYDLENYYYSHYKPEDLVKRNSRLKVALSFAYFMVGNTQILCYTTKEKPTKAYKVDKNYKETNEVWKNAKFIRYCSSMDL